MKKTKPRKKKDEIVIDVTRHSGREKTPEERLVIDLAKTSRALDDAILRKIELEKQLTSLRDGLRYLHRKLNLRRAFLQDQVIEVDDLTDMVGDLLRTCQGKTKDGDLQSSPSST